MLPLTIELHDPDEKVFHNAPVSPMTSYFYVKQRVRRVQLISLQVQLN